MLAIAVVVVAGVATGLAIALSGGSDEPEIHTLPGGQVHTGPMPEGQHQMDGGQMMDDDRMMDDESMK